MPIYEYRCHTCGKEFSVQAKMADAPPTRGLDCVSNKCQLEKQMSLTAGIVKGSHGGPSAAHMPCGKPSGVARDEGCGTDNSCAPPIKPHCAGGCSH